MYRLLALKVLRLVVLSSLFFCARAFAQSEVAPDHFDSATSHNTVKGKAKSERVVKAKLVAPASVVAKAMTLPDRQNRELSASRTAPRLRHGKDVQQRLRNQAVAAPRKCRDKEQDVAVSR